ARNAAGPNNVNPPERMVSRPNPMATIAATNAQTGRSSFLPIVLSRLRRRLIGNPSRLGRGCRAGSGTRFCLGQLTLDIIEQSTPPRIDSPRDQEAAHVEGEE